MDATYVWVHGGYQIARSHDDYPVFIQVHNRDVELWIAFFDRFGVEATIDEHLDASDVDGAVHYVLVPKPDGIDVEWVGGNPVVPLDEAVEQMMANRPAYALALEIVPDEYNADVEAHHHRSTSAE